MPYWIHILTCMFYLMHQHLEKVCEHYELSLREEIPESKATQKRMRSDLRFAKFEVKFTQKHLNRNKWILKNIEKEELQDAHGGRFLSLRIWVVRLCPSVFLWAVAEQL